LIDESDAIFGVATISDVPTIEHRQLPGLKLDDTYFFPKKLDDLPCTKIYVGPKLWAFTLKKSHTP